MLVANPAASRQRSGELDAIVTMLGAVIAARGRKYLMMNAPATHLAELEDLLPGLESPSVIPLAHAGMIAIHAVVGADEVWGLLPRLKAAGRVGDPGPADREDPPVSATPASARTLRLRRLDLREPDPAADALSATPCSGAVRCPIPSSARRRGRSSPTSARAAPTPSARRRRASAADGPTVACSSTRAELAGAAGALHAPQRDALEAAIANVRRFAETQRPATTRTSIVAGRRDRATLAAGVPRRARTCRAAPRPTPRRWS